MNYAKITLKELQEKGACQPAVDYFKTVFPGGETPVFEWNINAYLWLMACLENANKAKNSISWMRWMIDKSILLPITKANLRWAYLQGANLQEAYLQEANLRGANLQGANLQEANLQEAYLQGANLQGANLQGAKYNNTTVFSAGVDPVSAGMILVE